MPQLIPVIVGGLAAGGAAYGISELTKPKGGNVPQPDIPEPPAPPTLEEAPSINDAEVNQARERARRFRTGRGRRSTILGGSVGPDAPNLGKSLLGE